MSDSGETTCPYCAETIKAAAIKCRYCGEMLGLPEASPVPGSLNSAFSDRAGQAASAAPAPPGDTPPPVYAPPTPPGSPQNDPSQFMIREDGKNGTVEIFADRIVRTRKKHLGKDDLQTIPIKSISGVHHDRKTLGSDLVRLDVGAVSYEWKVSNAESMVAELHKRMF